MTDPTPVFVFGSNLAGRHGAGAALWALKNRGAIYGVGAGRQGMSFAIPTKDGREGRDLKDPRETLSVDEIAGYVAGFLKYAAAHPREAFELTPIGCGLGGYMPAQIAPMFAAAPPNVMLPDVFKTVLERTS